MKRIPLGKTVFDATLERLLSVYEEGHRVVLSFSAGKDSGICLEMCILAAGISGKLPVEVVMRDEEVMFPGTFEYAERAAARPEVDFHWLVANQPIVNVFNRAEPYFWVFDPLLDPEQWVRQPPEWHTKIPDLNITAMVTPERFPPPPDKWLIDVIGLRANESARRTLTIASTKGQVTKPNSRGTRHMHPIYDWADGDVWKAVKDNGWDYNEAYDVMARMGVPRSRLRIAPPTLHALGVRTLGLAQKSWPHWFDRVATRLPGVRTAAQYGIRSVTPFRRLGESWAECYQRECIDSAPQWVADRARTAQARVLAMHTNHATTPFPEIEPCLNCKLEIGSWKKLAVLMYNGDPFALRTELLGLKYIEPEYFREGAGFWGGKPTF